MTIAASPQLEPLHGDLKVSADGLFSCRGPAAALLHALDSHFCAAALRRGAEDRVFPTLISEKTLERCEHLTSFPGYASRVEASGRSERYFLSPDVCYHTYELLAGSELEGSAIMTSAGSCFRDDPADGRHLWEFTMREVVFLGDYEFVRAQRQEWLELATRWASALHLEASPELANDPFFAGTEGRGRKILQHIKELKYELRAPDSSGASVAVASFNLHEQFFGKQFGIVLRNGEPAFSGCVGFGLERWALALLTRYPADEGLRRVEFLS
jgi:seryl-tRNA synthetase